MKKKKKKAGEKKTKKIKEILFNDDEIQDLKDIQSEREILSDEELEDLQELKKTISVNQLNLGILYARCYDHVEINLSEFRSDETDYSKKIREFLDQFEINEMRSLVSNYGFNKQFGDSLTEIKIKTLIEKNRKNYLKLIKFFFQLFSGE